MNTWKDFLAVLEIEKADKSLPVNDMFEKFFRGMVRGDSGGYDQTSAAMRVEEIKECFGKDGIGIQIADTGEREPPPGSSKLTRRLRLPLRGLKLYVQSFFCWRGVVSIQLSNTAVAFCLVRRGSNLRRA